MKRVIIVARAKVNLLLRVLERDGTGYHDVDTLFCALELADSLEVSLTDGPGPVGLEVVGAELGPPARNLAHQAATDFRQLAGIDRGVEMRLVKRIPAGGGLGGGSSDAAAALRALAGFVPDLPYERLTPLAERLGSDVPFFLSGAPLAWGSGRGERITALPALPQRPVLLVLPPFGVRTAEAYAWLDEDREATGGCAAPAFDREEVSSSWEAVAAVSANDFETPVFRRYPTLRRARDAMARAGAAPALLAGSGSTVFGVFQDDAALDRAEAAIRKVDPAFRTVRTRTAR